MFWKCICSSEELRLRLEGGRPPLRFTVSAVTLLLVGQWTQDNLQSVEPTGPVPAVTAVFFFPTLSQLSLSCVLSPRKT